MNKILVCDIDGTIADLSHRLHYIQGDKKDWESFYDEVDKDKPIKVIVDLIIELSEKFSNYKIIFLTGRNEICRKKTSNWLLKLKKTPFIKNRFNAFPLLMRKQNDHRPDTEVKPELLEQYLEDNPDSKVAFILDDRNSMVKKWRELGYTCLQVVDGDF